MLLEITNETEPATDLGYLLHKHPANVRTVELSFGRGHVFYPDADERRCTAALVLDVDPVRLVRRGGASDFALAQYVNDRPYVISSFMSTAIAKLFGTAMGGTCEARPELVDRRLRLSVRMPVVPARGGADLAHRLFDPLGYTTEAEAIGLDPRFPDWGESRFLDVGLTTSGTVADVLRHLYILLPVLDDQKHYWVQRDEIDKLLERGRDWLAGHPERDLITRRYLRHERALTREALARLTEEDQPDPDAVSARRDREEEAIEAPLRLGDERVAAVVEALRSSGARRVLDLGCGGGRLLAALVREGQFEELVGVDVSVRALEAASRRLNLESASPKLRERVRLLQGALTYRDRRLEGFDAAVLMEVVEHVDAARLGALEWCVFGVAAPGTIVITTPNVEYNGRFAGLPAGSLRHRDHRFEWTRAEFRAWAGDVAARNGYRVRFLPVGHDDPSVGPPTQMAVFAR